MAWQEPKTDWVANPKNPVPEDFNRIEGNIDFLKSDIETKKCAIVNALNTVGLASELTDTHAQIANKIVAANQGTKIYTPSTVNQPIPKGFHSGQGYVEGDTNLVPSSIVKGKSIFGVIGTAIEGKPFATGTVISGGTYGDLIEVSGIAFKPRYAILWRTSTDTAYRQAFGILSSNQDIPYGSGMGYGITGSYVSTDRYFARISNQPMTDDGFSFFIEGGMHYPPSMFRWIAIAE